MIRRNPLACFFTLAYLISWLVWTPFVLSRDGLGVLPFTYPRVMGDSQLLGILPGGYLGPLTAAFVVTAVSGGRAGLRRWCGRLLRWRVAARWYLLAVVGVPLAIMLATLALPGAATGVHPPPAELAVVYLPILVLQMLTTGLAEEPGWRDFALPRLQERHGPVPGTLLLGVLWAGWHLPLFLTTWSSRHLEPATLLVYLVLAVSLSIVITWMFNRTGQSLPVAMLAHASNNSVLATVWAAVFPALDEFRDSLRGSAIGFGLFAVVLVGLTRGRLGYPGPTGGRSRPSTSGSAQLTVARR